MTNLDFTNEAATIIRFPSVRQFEAFRAEVENRYDARMVLVNWYKVPSKESWVEGRVRHARGLGAELKGLAHSQFDGHSINTIYPGE